MEPLLQMEIILQMEPSKPSMLKFTDSASLHLINVMSLVNTMMGSVPMFSISTLMATTTSLILPVAMLVTGTRPGYHYNGQNQNDYYDRGWPDQEYRGMQRRSRSPQPYQGGRHDERHYSPPHHNAQGNGGPQGNGGHELPEYIDPELTQEHVLSDIHVLPNWPADQHVTKHTQLTSHETSFLNALFDNWNSRFDPPIDPELPARQGKQTQLEVVTLNQDHPPPIARQDPVMLQGAMGEEEKADKVSLGLSLNYETGSVLWTWSDSQKQGVSHQYVTLDRGKTGRIKQHNKDLLVECSRRAIKRWVHDGTGRVSVLNPDEHPKLQKLVLAGDIVRSDAARQTEVSRLADASGLGNGKCVIGDLLVMRLNGGTHFVLASNCIDNQAVNRSHLITFAFVVIKKLVSHIAMSDIAENSATSIPLLNPLLLLESFPFLSLLTISFPMPPLADPVARAGSNTNNHSGRSCSRSRSPRGRRSRDINSNDQHRRRSRHPGDDDDDDERQTLSPPVPSDSDELTETVVRHGSRVAVSRRADAHVDTHEFLTSREKYIFLLLQLIRNTRESPYRITCGCRNSILKSIFDHWNTKLPAPANPILPGRLMEHTFIEGGTLKSDQPLPNSKRRACKTVVEDYRTRGAAVRLGVYINPDTNSISFPWTDTEGNPHVHGNKGFGVPGIDDPANEPAVAPITKYDNLAPDEYQKAPKFQSKVGQLLGLQARTSWHVDNAARRASKACPDKLVARVLPWKREFANLQRVTDAEPAVTQTDGHSLASNVDMAMAHHLDASELVNLRTATRHVFLHLSQRSFGYEPRLLSCGTSISFDKPDWGASQRLGSNKGQKRANEWDAGLLKQHEARKKGQPAYYTVTVNKGVSLQFSWKDAKGKIGASDKVELQPDWDMTRAEFETKFRHDLYWGNAMKSFYRDLTIATGRSMLRKFAEAKAKGSAFPLGGEHVLGDLMVNPLTRDVDDATIAKIEAHASCLKEMGRNRVPSFGVLGNFTGTTKWGSTHFGNGIKREMIMHWNGNITSGSIENQWVVNDYKFQDHNTDCFHLKWHRQIHALPTMVGVCTSQSGDEALRE
ncbi:hypothetical protein FMUND_12754 [Fusarium mundagurra]|uniref:Uncharacterized protein n=1 Tax=Fusarium mundagurra TaxID=1567541 RepID=A0A8H6D5D8_9HYPO|nr:hypothetical protein FMUND_12754 [Fusarium mundagurra]